MYVSDTLNHHSRIVVAPHCSYTRAFPSARACRLQDEREPILKILRRLAEEGAKP